MSTLDPQKVPTMSLDELVEAYAQACEEEEQVVTEKIMLREAILPLIPGDGTVSGEYTVSRMKKGMLRIPTKTAEKKEAMEKLKELGLVKMVEQPDHKAAQVMHEKGIKLPVEFSYTVTPLIRRIKQEEAIQE